MPAIVNAEKCEGCGDCVDVCPTEAIVLENGKAIVSEDDCADCGACEPVCPTEAITIE